jgi:cold shock CspA family protein
VHVTAVQAAGLDTLNEGQRVSYEVVPDAGAGVRASGVGARRFGPLL